MPQPIGRPVGSLYTNPFGIRLRRARPLALHQFVRASRQRSVSSDTHRLELAYTNDYYTIDRHYVRIGDDAQHFWKPILQGSPLYTASPLHPLYGEQFSSLSDVRHALMTVSGEHARYGYLYPRYILQQGSYQYELYRYGQTWSWSYSAWLTIRISPDVFPTRQAALDDMNSVLRPRGKFYRRFNLQWR